MRWALARERTKAARRKGPGWQGRTSWHQLRARIPVDRVARAGELTRLRDDTGGLAIPEVRPALRDDSCGFALPSSSGRLDRPRFVGSMASLSPTDHYSTGSIPAFELGTSHNQLEPPRSSEGRFFRSLQFRDDRAWPSA